MKINYNAALFLAVSFALFGAGAAIVFDNGWFLVGFAAILFAAALTVDVDRGDE